MDFIFIDSFFASNQYHDSSFIINTLIGFLITGGICCLIQRYLQKDL